MHSNLDLDNMSRGVGTARARKEEEGTNKKGTCKKLSVFDLQI